MRRFARCTASAVLLTTTIAASAFAQADMAPVNSPPNPYRTIEGWAKMPEGRTWGSTSAVAIDTDGTSIWVAERCGANNCVGSALDPVLKFNARGDLVAHFGAGMILSPHGIFVDRDDNVWVVDCACTIGGRGRGAPAAATPGAPQGHQVYKFSPTGKLLMTLGTAGGARAPGYFPEPTAVLVAPNGDIYVAEGHSSRPATDSTPASTARVLKFSKDGKFLTAWGQWGKSPNDFDQPHALAMDSKGRLYVGDRGNNRVKIFDQNGTLLDTWYQFSRPSGIFIDAHDNIYVADSESQSVSRTRTDWLRGIRVGNVRDGKVTAFIPDPAVNPPSTSSAEGVAVDRNGVIYGAEVGQKDLKRYITP